MTVSAIPNPDTIRAAILLAGRAPSVHNSQPWHWRARPDGLDLYAEPDLHLTSIDPDRRDLILSCGASLHHAVTALAALGWRARIQRFPDPCDRHHLATVGLVPHEPSELDLTLAAAIPRRRTDRRRYGSKQVSPADVALMGARAARAGVTLRRAESIANLTELIERAASLHAGDIDYLHELTEWSGRYGSQAGNPARNTPDPDPTAPIPARFFAGTALAQPLGSADIEDNAAVIALGTRDDDELARLRAGEATSLVLLTATALGLASCPITEPLEIAETRATLRSEIFEDDAFPQMLLRIGWAVPGAVPLPATPRRPPSW
jgi:nitroreductase